MKKIILFGALFLALVLVCGSVSAAKGEPVKDIDVMGFPFRHLQTQVDSFFDVFTKVADYYNVDSFFDVFVEIDVKTEDLKAEVVTQELRIESNTYAIDNNTKQVVANKYKIDSFFDITYEINSKIDSFFDVFTEVSELFGVDSFFDVFTELKAKDEHIETEIVSMQLQSKKLQETLEIIVQRIEMCSIAIENQSTQITELSAKLANVQAQADNTSFSVDSFFDVFTELSIAIENQQTQITELSANVESIDNAVEEIAIIVEQIEPYSIAIENQQNQTDALYFIVSEVIKDKYGSVGSFFDDLYLKQGGDPLKGLNVAKAKKEMENKGFGGPNCLA